MSTQKIKKLCFLGVFVVSCFPFFTFAASISVSPATGVYTTGGTFSVRVQVDTSGKPINAADGTVTFNPKELSVVSLSKGSVFSLWTAEPTYSNSAGTISFSGGSPTGYTGSAGTVLTVTFKALTSGAARVSLTGGSVLAADGRGTNVLTNMNGGTYTLSAVTSQPEPEVIVEYVPPANTPAAPKVTSKSHPDSASWYTVTTADLAWTVPEGVTSVRTLLDNRPSTVPTKVYDSPISSLSIPDLPEGESYFHIQFKNADGWGKVTHYRLAIDTKKPDTITIAPPAEVDTTNPVQAVAVTNSEKDGSPVVRYIVRIDNQDPVEGKDIPQSGKIELPTLEPGHHTISVEFFDAAGNSYLTTTSITIEAFEKPVFHNPPVEIAENMIPVFKGTTRPNARVEVSLAAGTAEPQVYTVTSDETGAFNFIPDTAFAAGTYTLTARATDQHGAVSEASDSVRFAVQKPGYMVVGSLIINILSTIITILVLAAALVVVCWYTVVRLRVLRGRVRRESDEAVTILHREFAAIRDVLSAHQIELVESRKTKKLTKAEEELLSAVTGALSDAEVRVAKEVSDVRNLVGKK